MILKKIQVACWEGERLDGKTENQKQLFSNSVLCSEVSTECRSVNFTLCIFFHAPISSLQCNMFHIPKLAV
jgi:hypothetical protein